MAAVGDDSDRQKPAFRWLDLVRYAVAAVVTVLIVAVIVNAIRVVLRPDSLTLSVVGGTVSMSRFPGPPEDVLKFDFTLQAVNPSGRVPMCYTNITAYLFDKNMSASTTHPQDDCFVFSPLEIIEQCVQQQRVLQIFTAVNGTRDTMTMSYFDMLYNTSSSIGDATLRLDGDLTTEFSYGHNRTTRAIYYCRPLLVGGDPNDGKDAPCSPAGQ